MSPRLHVSLRQGGRENYCKPGKQCVNTKDKLLSEIEKAANKMDPNLQRRI
jgi:hypothetical protein